MEITDWIAAGLTCVSIVGFFTSCLFLSLNLEMMLK